VAPPSRGARARAHRLRVHARAARGHLAARGRGVLRGARLRARLAPP
jgi:hypothetical protein